MSFDPYPLDLLLKNSEFIIIEYDGSIKATAEYIYKEYIFESNLFLLTRRYGTKLLCL